MCKSKSRETGNLSTRNTDGPRNAVSKEFIYICNFSEVYIFYGNIDKLQSVFVHVRIIIKTAFPFYIDVYK